MRHVDVILLRLTSTLCTETIVSVFLSHPYWVWNCQCKSYRNTMLQSSPMSGTRLLTKSGTVPKTPLAVSMARLQQTEEQLQKDRIQARRELDAQRKKSSNLEHRYSQLQVRSPLPSKLSENGSKFWWWSCFLELVGVGVPYTDYATLTNLFSNTIKFTSNCLNMLPRIKWPL